MLCAVSGAVFWKRNSHTVEMSGAPDQTRKMKISHMLPCSVSVSPSAGGAMYRHLVPPKCTSAVTNNVWLWPRLCWNLEMLLHISNELKMCFKVVSMLHWLVTGRRTRHPMPVTHSVTCWPSAGQTVMVSLYRPISGQLNVLCQLLGCRSL